MKLESTSDFGSHWCGLTGYSAGLELQEWATQRVVEHDTVAVLLGLEHDPVITLGRQSTEDDLLAVDTGFEVVRTTRGGRATLHEPGQLVVYPIVNLQKLNLGVMGYVAGCLTALAKTVQAFGLDAWMDIQDPGVYTKNGKIGFVGIQVTHGITRHGLSLNVSNPLGRFKTIRPCGKDQQVMSSLAHQGVNATPKYVFETFTQNWACQFGLTSSPRAANFDAHHAVCWRSW